MAFSPIILFTYNRADYLRKTLTWLGQNELANQSTLYVYCDGPKANVTVEQLSKIENTRKVAHELAVVPTFKEVHFIEQKSNYGLGTSIINGVTDIITKHGRAIIVEDDIQTSPYFLSFMNQCLDHYEDRKTVFSITGLSRPHPERFYPKDYPYDVYVSLTHRPWGWATWADRWNLVDWKANAYLTIKHSPYMQEAFCRLGADYYGALCAQQETPKDVWSIRFALAHFANHAVSIAPIVSYTNHFGWGEDATNATASGQWTHERLADNANIRFLDVLYEDSRIINAWYSFSMPQRRSLWGRLMNWFGRTYLNKDEYALKGRVFA